MKKPELLMIGDFGKDLDDENALLYALGAQKQGRATLSAVVANLTPEDQRARLAQGMLDVLDVQIDVGLGTSCSNAGITRAYEIKVPYLSTRPLMHDGTELLAAKLAGSVDHSMTLILNSGLTDAARLIDRYPDLMRRKLAVVAIMGGVLAEGGKAILTRRGRMTPNDAANNMFDFAAAEFVYEWLQAENVPMSILTREAAYDCYFPFDFYNSLAATGNPIGTAIRDRHKPATNNLWLASQSATGTPARGELPMRCNRDWFIDTYLSGIDPGNTADAWSTAGANGKIQLYDPLNVASIVQPELFDPAIIRVNGTRHQIIGIGREQTGIKDTEALRKHIAATEILALTTPSLQNIDS